MSSDYYFLILNIRKKTGTLSALGDVQRKVYTIY